MNRSTIFVFITLFLLSLATVAQATGDEINDEHPDENSRGDAEYLIMIAQNMQAEAASRIEHAEGCDVSDTKAYKSQADGYLSQAEEFFDMEAYSSSKEYSYKAKEYYNKAISSVRCENADKTEALAMIHSVEEMLEETAHRHAEREGCDGTKFGGDYIAKAKESLKTANYKVSIELYYYASQYATEAKGYLNTANEHMHGECVRIDEDTRLQADKALENARSALDKMEEQIRRSCGSEPTDGFYETAMDRYKHGVQRYEDKDYEGAYRLAKEVHAYLEKISLDFECSQEAAAEAKELLYKARSEMQTLLKVIPDYEDDREMYLRLKEQYYKANGMLEEGIALYNKESYEDAAEKARETLAFLKEVFAGLPEDTHDDEDVVVIPPTVDDDLETTPGCLAGYCSVDDRCVQAGVRFLKDTESAVFCDLDGSVREQKKEGDACQNSFECVSNSCASGTCYDLQKQLAEQQSLLKRILEWVKWLF